MQRSSLPLGVSTLKKWMEDKGCLRGDLPFQRNSGMWNNITQSNLIWGLLADSYIPPIVLLKDKVGKDEKNKDIYHYQILDGLQRLTTLFKFINGEFALHSATAEVEVDGTIYDLAGLTFSGLSEECQEAILNYRFSVQCLENYTYEEAERLFFNINSGVALSTIQKSKAKMGTELISFLNSLLAQGFFTQGINITEKQAKNEDDLCLLLQGMLLLDNMYEGREYKNISTGTCLGYAESIRGNYAEEKKDRLEQVIAYLSQAFPNKNKFLRKNNVPVVIVCAWIALLNNVEAHNFRRFINDFASGIYEEYDEASGSGNVRASKVQMRLRVMFLVMCGFFGFVPEDTIRPFSADIPLRVNSDGTPVNGAESTVVGTEEAESSKISTEELESILAFVLPTADNTEIEPDGETAVGEATKEPEEGYVEEAIGEPEEEAVEEAIGEPEEGSVIEGFMNEPLEEAESGTGEEAVGAESIHGMDGEEPEVSGTAEESSGVSTPVFEETE